MAGGLVFVPRLFAFTDTYVHVSSAAFLILVSAIVMGLYWFWGAEGLTGRNFGAANTITLSRGVLICLIAGSIGQAWSTEAAWAIVATSSFALIMDGFDGWYARRQGQESPFGALFDQETDAAFILILTVLVVDQDKAGAWIILSGLLRYLFVGAGFIVPRLQAPLGPSMRRKTVCVIQVVALVVCLAPIVPSMLSGWIAATSLALLVYSFAVDVIALLRQPPA